MQSLTMQIFVKCRMYLKLERNYYSSHKNVWWALSGWLYFTCSMWLWDLLQLNKTFASWAVGGLHYSHMTIFIISCLFFLSFFSILMENVKQETTVPEAPASYASTVSPKNESEKLKSKVCWWRRILGWKKVRLSELKIEHYVFSAVLTYNWYMDKICICIYMFNIQQKTSCASVAECESADTEQLCSGSEKRYNDI